MKQHKKRIGIWLILVSLIIAVMFINAIFPQLELIPIDMNQWIIMAVFVLALCCEFVDSSIGMGYGTTLAPLLLLIGFEPLQVIPCILFSEFITGLTAAVMHHKDGNVDFLKDKSVRKTTITLSVLSVVGTIVAVVFAFKISKFWLTASIATMIILVGILTLITIKKKFKYRSGHILFLGLIASFNKGMSGGGYGPLVTSGQVVSGISPKQAISITSLTESLTCFVGLIVFFILGRGSINWTLLWPLTMGAMLSVPIATLAVKKIPDKFIRIIIGAISCVLGLFIFYKILI